MNKIISKYRESLIIDILLIYAVVAKISGDFYIRKIRIYVFLYQLAPLMQI